MNNPWEDIDLDIYEGHMSSAGVLQSQALNAITARQLNEHDSSVVAILGIAGGNGLDHVDLRRTKKIYGIDVNCRYLASCRERYAKLNGALETLCLDLTRGDIDLPFSSLLICNLIVEYLGAEVFIELVKKNKRKIGVLSCVIQKNNGSNFVSVSDRTSAFDAVASTHHDIDADVLILGLEKIGLDLIKMERYPLPNGKELIRLDLRDPGKRS